MGQSLGNIRKRINLMNHKHQMRTIHRDPGKSAQPAQQDQIQEACRQDFVTCGLPVPSWQIFWRIAFT